MPRRRKRVKPPEQLEEHLKKHLKTDWVRVLRIGKQTYSKYSMGYAVALIPKVVRGVVTDEVIPALVRFNTETGFTTQLIPLDPDVIDPLIELIREGYREALRRSLTPK